MSLDLRRLTRCAVLTALALALSVAEGLVPLTILFPLPGLRLGLANLVTVYALCRLSRREALLILLARCLLGALVGGNLTALAFSLTGGALALGVMAAAVRLGALSLFGVSRRCRPQYRTDSRRHGGAGQRRALGLPAAAAAVLPGHGGGHRRGLHLAGPAGAGDGRKKFLTNSLPF